eukprot:m.494448 g.494448  ORF g.494448 m.494448 type:complete len:107 (-) comp21795_c0_seq33:1477-1797(-)
MKMLMVHLLGGCKVLVVDVRPSVEYGICHINPSVNLPLPQLLHMSSETLSDTFQDCAKIFVVCRRGNDSQLGVQFLRGKMCGMASVRDLRGGLLAWSKFTPEFPQY